MFKIGAKVAFNGKTCEVVARIKVSGSFVYTIEDANNQKIALVPERSLRPVSKK